MDNHNELRVCIQKKYDLIWQEAYKTFHEMSISMDKKNINPCLIYDIEGLQPDKLYRMALHFERSDNLRWLDKDNQDGPADAPFMSNTVWHDMEAQSGEFWMTRGCSFIFAKLTKRIDPPQNEISLCLYHKYIPVLSVYLWSDNQTMRMPPASFRIAHTEFLATPYPSTNERLIMLTKKSKKHFKTREQIRQNGKDNRTVYAACRIEHYLPHTPQMPKTPIWCLLNRKRLSIDRSGSNSFVPAENSDTPRDVASQVPEAEMATEIRQEFPILQTEDDVVGNLPANGFISPVSKVNTGNGEKQVKLENPSSSQADFHHVPHTGDYNPDVKGSISAAPHVNIAIEENQGRIKVENPNSPQTNSRCLPHTSVCDPDVDGFTSPVHQVNMEFEQNQERIKIENPGSPQTNSRHSSHTTVCEPPVNSFTSPVPQIKVETGENQRRIKVENSDSHQTEFCHHPDNVTGTLPVNGFDCPLSPTTLQASETRKRVKLKNPSSPQSDFRCLPDNFAGEPSVNEFTSPDSQLMMETGVKPTRIKRKNRGSPQKVSCHVSHTVTYEPIANSSPSYDSQLTMDTGVKHKKIKAKNPSSSQMDSCHLSHTVNYEPLADSSPSPVPKKKRRTRAKQIIPQDSCDAPQPTLQTMVRPTSSSNYSHTFPPVSSFLPGAFSSQHPPVQTPNFTNFPYLGMQPNPYHLAMYHHIHSYIWGNYQNPHPINSQVPLIPQANGSNLHNPLMTLHPILSFPTTSSHQNMIPNNQIPDFNNIQVPSPPSTDGSDSFLQPPQNNSSHENTPNSDRSPKREN